VLRDKQSANAMTPAGATSLFAPFFVLLGTLVVAQVFWRRRFRRRLNLWLAAATAVVLALGTLSCLVFVSDSRLDTAADKLRTLIADTRSQTFVTDDRAQRALYDSLEKVCDNATCSYSVELFRSKLAEVDATEEEPVDALLTEKMRRVSQLTGKASANAGLVTPIYVLGAFLGSAILLGFRSRLIEYRYRSR
jgi:hypothetical protein